MRERERSVRGFRDPKRTQHSPASGRYGDTSRSSGPRNGSETLFHTARGFESRPGFVQLAANWIAPDTRLDPTGSTLPATVPGVVAAAC